jgi:CHAT domain-containing protein
MFSNSTGQRFCQRAIGGCALLLLLLVCAMRVSAQDAAEAQKLVLSRANELYGTAVALEARGDWERALEARRQVVQLLEEGSGDTQRHTDIARTELAALLVTLGRYGEAREVLQRSLQARTKVLPKGAIEIPEVLNLIGETYRKEGLLTNSLTCYEQARELLQPAPRPVALLGVVLNNQAMSVISLGDNAGAEHLLTNSLQVFAEIPGINPALLAPPLSTLGELHRNLGQLDQALREQRQALALLTNVAATHPIRLVVNNNLASVCRDLELIPEAIQIYSNTLAQLQPLRGTDDLEVLQVRRNLAEALALDENLAGSRRLIEDVLQRLLATGRTNLPVYLGALTDAGAQQQNCGDLPAARRSFQTALDLALVRHGPDHLLTCENRERLAMLAMAGMDLARAHELLDQALAARQRNAERDPRRRFELVAGYLEWAKFERVLGRADEADDCLKQALAIQAALPRTNHTVLAETLEQRGLLAGEGNRLQAALEYHQAARRIRADAMGESSLPVAQSRMNLAEVLARQGEIQAALAEARPAMDAFSTRLGPDHPRTLMAAFGYANLRHRAGDFTNAAALYARALAGFERLGVRYAAVAALDSGLLEVDRGRLAAAVEFADRAREVQDRLWQNRLRFGSEVDRLAGDGHASVVTLLAEVAPTNPLPLATAVLRWKGAVLDSLVEDRQLAARAGDPACATNVQALKTARLRRYELALAAGSRQPPTTNEVRQAAAEVERLESQLAQRFSALGEIRRASTVTAGTIQTSLPPDTVLIEFVRYERWRGGGRTEPAFGALVLGRETTPRWVPLGGAEGAGGIAGLVHEFHTLMREPALTNSAALLAAARALHNRLWYPVQPWLTNGIKSVVIAPDAELNFVPFAALWRGDHFLGQDYWFRYVTSGRDLLAPALDPPTTRTVDIYGAPQFSRPAWQRGFVAAVKALWTVPVMSGGTATHLPGSYEALDESVIEAQVVAQTARTNRGVPTPFLNAEASEAQLRRRPPPYVLHLATHGTFLPDQAQPARSAISPNPPHFGLARNAMSRAWIALAGANETLDAWRRGEPPAPANDGLLTADEVASLDLTGTWLVTLSACDTGVGIARGGEGVFGLRRAFGLAGAQHLVVTLWPVRDRHSREFMTEFYADALTANDPAGALARVQRKKLADWTKSDGSARALRWAGPYVLSSRGSLPR